MITEEIKNEITVEDIESLINERDDFMKWNNSRIDSAVSKGVEAFKTKTMPKEIENAVSKAKEDFMRELNPQKTPAELKIEALERKLQEKEEADKRKDLEVLITNETAKASIPQAIVDFVKPSLLTSSDRDECLSKLTDFKVVWGDVAKDIINSDYKVNGTTPKKSTKGKVDDFDSSLTKGDTKKALRSLLSEI